jgi:UDP-N-acetylmuramoylalanine--D-glutamate ligase
VNDFADRKVTVLGLGRFGGGAGVARWLARQGARVTVTDAQTADRLTGPVDDLAGLGITFKLGGHDPTDFREADLVVANPAVPPTSDMLDVAHKSGVPVTTEMRLLIERLPTPLVFGVTGTKGKSTTAALLARMLTAWQPLPKDKAKRLRAVRSSKINLADAGRRKVWVGGNLGGSLLNDLEHISDRDFVVLELSSYMLARLDGWSPHIAVVTMIGSDHLAWHGSQQAYVEAKRTLVKHQGEDDFAVLPSPFRKAREFADHTSARVIEYGKRAHLPEAIAPMLLGKHNRINERGAFAAANLVGIYPEQAADACADFVGLPHRLELVHTDGRGVRWVNDSIATIPEAAVAACEAFPADTVIQIVGGSDKGNDLTPLRDVLPKRCKHVLTIGATGRSVEGEYIGDLTTAVARARDLAEPGDVVLLSPGFASYDQFANFEERGEAFRRLATEERE